MTTVHGPEGSPRDRIRSSETKREAARPTDFEYNLKRWILPIIATGMFSLLLIHKSEDSPVVFNRYSINYAILLIVAALNLSLLWQKSLLHISLPTLFSYTAAVVSFTCLFDFFVIGLNLPFFPSPEPDWVTLVFVASFLLQMTAFPCLILKDLTARISCAFRRPGGAERDDGRESGAKPGWHRLLNAALVGCSVMFVVITAELVFRFFLLQPLMPKNRREFVQLMSAQWPEEVSLVKSSDTFRILGLADSYGVVGGKYGNYHYLLQNDLRRQVSRAIQMVNVSVSGYEPRHELAIMRFGMAYAPDVVLHGFFVGNDFTLYGEDNYEFRGIRIENQPDVSRYWPRHFYLVDMIRNQLIRLRDLQQIDFEQKAGVAREAGYLSKKFFLQMQFQRMMFLQKQSENDMKKVLPILRSIREIAEKGGARYVMVIHPDQTQVDKILRKEVLKTFHVREEDYDFDFPQKVLTSYCAAIGILCLDLLPAFRAKANQGALYTISDGHYNLNGNRLAADTIRQFLLDRHLFYSMRGNTITQAAAMR